MVGTDINTSGALSDVAYLDRVGGETFTTAQTINAAGGLTIGSNEHFRLPELRL